MSSRSGLAASACWGTSIDTTLLASGVGLLANVYICNSRSSLIPALCLCGVVPVLQSPRRGFAPPWITTHVHLTTLGKTATNFKIWQFTLKPHFVCVFAHIYRSQYNLQECFSQVRGAWIQAIKSGGIYLDLLSHLIAQLLPLANRILELLNIRGLHDSYL